MRVLSWDEFAQKAKKMYIEEPMRTRYLVRYNHDRSRLCVKVTDDVKVCNTCWHTVTACIQRAWEIESVNNGLQQDTMVQETEC